MTEKQLIPKRAADARDARTSYCKLFKSGAIPAIQKPRMKQMSFKRPKAKNGNESYLSQMLHRINHSQQHRVQTIFQVGIVAHRDRWIGNQIVYTIVSC